MAKKKKNNKKNIILAIILTVIIAIIIGVLWQIMNTPQIQETPQKEEFQEIIPSSEEAEFIGHDFMLQFLKLENEEDTKATEMIFFYLSKPAKEKIDKSNFKESINQFLKVSKIPKQGINIEDLQIKDFHNTSVIIELNFSEKSKMRKLDLIVENGEWKINEVTEYENDKTGIPAAKAVLKYVMDETRIDELKISIVSVNEKEWPDGCLGLTEKDEVCPMVIVPGYEIVVNAAQEIKTFRTDMEGTMIREEI